MMQHDTRPAEYDIQLTGFTEREHKRRTGRRIRRPVTTSRGWLAALWCVALLAEREQEMRSHLIPTGGQCVGHVAMEEGSEQLVLVGHLSMQGRASRVPLDELHIRETRLNQMRPAATPSA